MHGVRREHPATRRPTPPGLPLLTVPLPWPCTERDLRSADARRRARAAVADGFTHVAFGDLFLEDVRRYREERLAGTGLTPLFPLWGRPTPMLAREMIAGGLTRPADGVDPRVIPARWSARDFDSPLLADLPADRRPVRRARRVSHLRDRAARCSRRRVDVEPGAVVERDGFVYADFLPAAPA